jgi:hypothetical protein
MTTYRGLLIKPIKIFPFLKIAILNENRPLNNSDIIIHQIGSLYNPFPAMKLNKYPTLFLDGAAPPPIDLIVG